jgi:hypothetical protein
MKRSKKLLILLGVLVVVCLVTLIVSRIEIRKEEIKNSDETILALSTDSIDALSWRYNGTDLSFTRDDGWHYDGDAAFPVDEAKIDALLAQFEDFGAAFIIENVEDYGQYGLDDPLCTIDLTAGDTAYEITLDDYSTMDAQRYVSIGDGNVYLVTNDPLDVFDVTLDDLICNDSALSYASIDEVTFSGAENYTFTYLEEGGNSYRADDVYFTTQNGVEVPLDTALVTSYLKALKSLDFSTFVTYNATEDELAAYGLDDPTLTVTVQYTDEDDQTGTFVLHVARADTDSEDEDAVGYLRVGESPIVYQISADDFAALTDVSYDALRHLEVLSADFADVGQIDVTLDGASYTITCECSGDDRVFSYNDEEIDVTDLQSALEALSADSFTTASPTEKTEISLTLHLDLESEPVIQIDLYRNDGSTCLAVVDGAPVSLVQRSDVVNLIEAINAIVL